MPNHLHILVWVLGNGSVALNYMKMSIGTTVDTRKFVLPIHNTISITVNEGSNIDVNYDAELLPGSQLVIDDGATMNIASGATMYCYDGDEWNGKNYCLNNKNYMAQ